VPCLPRQPTGDLAQVVSRARREGSLPYSALAGGFRPRTPQPAAVADLIDRSWLDLGRPDPFFVAELLAGQRPTLPEAARLAQAAPALRALVVEPDAGVRGAWRLAGLEPPTLGGGPTWEAEDGDRLAAPGSGPVVSALAELPTSFWGLALALDPGDRLGADLYRRRAGGWVEVRLVAAGDGLATAELPADPAAAGALGNRYPAAGEGDDCWREGPSRQWLADLRARLVGGHLVVAGELSGRRTTPPSTSSVDLPAAPSGLDLTQIADVWRPAALDGGNTGPWPAVATWVVSFGQR
jgi:hypothetical protein